MRLNKLVLREVQAQRWTIKDLAAELDIEASTLNSYLTGRRKVPWSVVEGLQRVLKIPAASDLLGPDSAVDAAVTPGPGMETRGA